MATATVGLREDKRTESSIERALGDVRKIYVENGWKLFSEGPIINRDDKKPKVLLYFSRRISEEELIVFRRVFEINGINYDYTRGLELTAELLKP
jgi:hypothetical protein